MSNYQLQITLLSDAALGRGDGVAGLVNTEVQHDAYGCPYLGGRALKGLLREECVNLLYLLDKMNKVGPWEAAAMRLFGEPGSTMQESAAFLHVSDATLPTDLHAAIIHEIDETKQLTRAQVLDSFTTIRYQTAVDAMTEAPKRESLRAIRVVLRNTLLTAQIYLESAAVAEQQQQDLALLVACTKALRLAGTGRNRGVGELRAVLLDAQGHTPAAEVFDCFRENLQNGGDVCTA